MTYFAVTAMDHPPHAMALRDNVRQAHREYVIANAAPVKFVGPFLDQDKNQVGSFYIFESEDEQTVREWLEAEPFVKAGVYASIDIRLFQLGKNQLPARDLSIPN